MPMSSARSSTLVIGRPAPWASRAPMPKPARPPRPLTRRTDARARGWLAMLGRPGSPPPSPLPLPFLDLAWRSFAFASAFFLPRSVASSRVVAISDQIPAGLGARGPHELEDEADEALAIVLVDRLEAQPAPAVGV